MRCFMTGVSGFIGSATARQLLARGHQVVGLTPRPATVASLREAGVTPVVGDLRQPSGWVDAVREADVVIHLASLPVPSRPGSRYLTELLGAQKVAVEQMLAAVSSECRAFIVTSATSVYGPGSEVKTEESPVAPYRIAEPFALGESLALDAAGSGTAPAMVLRLGGVYGTGGVFGRYWAGPILAGKRAAIPGHGRQVYSFVHIDDCARAFVHVAEQPAPGTVFNVVDDEPVALGTIIQALAESAGAPRPFKLPGPVFRMAAGPLVGELLLNDKRVSNAKLKDTLAFDLEYPTYRDGLPALVRMTSVRRRVTG